MVLEKKKDLFYKSISVVVVRMKVGSHLYRTNIETSDIDYCTIYIPSIIDILLEKHKDYFNFESEKKNIKLEEKFFSLRRFIEIALTGDIVVLDMLHCKEDWPDVTSWIWKDLIKNRKMFYSKNMTSYLHYARKQALIYGEKGTRISIIKKILSILDNQVEKVGWECKVKDIWDILPKKEKHVHLLTDIKKPEIKLYQVCGRSFHETVSIEYLYNGLSTILKKYGSRSEDSEKNNGIDWKAIHHALRACLQLEELLTQETITIPSTQSSFLTEVKTGKIEYNKVSSILEEKISVIENLISRSSFPEHASKSWWEDWYINILNHVFMLRLKS